MIRAVLDANVLVSGLLSPQGIPARLLQAWREERFLLLLSSPILEEIERVLHYPKITKRLEWSKKEISEFIEDLSFFSLLTPDQLKVTVIAEDPADDCYLACAVEGEAHYLVSGDRHLLGLQEFRGIFIVRPRTFLAFLEEGKKQ